MLLWISVIDTICVRVGRSAAIVPDNKYVGKKKKKHILKLESASSIEHIKTTCYLQLRDTGFSLFVLFLLWFVYTRLSSSFFSYTRVLPTKEG